MATVTQTSATQTTSGWEKSKSNTQEKQQSTSTTKNVLDKALLQTLMGGLYGQMTDEEIQAYAENLMAPQRDAAILAAEQGRDTANLTLNQQITQLATDLAKAIEDQNNAYKGNMASVETAALQRGMGRSSYTLQTLANQGSALAKAVQQLTDENAQKTADIQNQIELNTNQAQQTINQANTSYAQSLASKIQELRNDRTQTYNSNYLSAVSSAMGQQTTQNSTATSDTTGSSESYSKTKSKSTSITSRGGSGTGGIPV